MGDVHYMISETAKRVGVESHVLRYWEEELALPIGRTEMGHRHYTEDDIQLFNCIKELKEQGMQLKELKGLIPDMLRAREQLRKKRQAEAASALPETSAVPEASVKAESAKPEAAGVSFDTGAMELLLSTMRQALAENNPLLEELICQGVTEKVTKDVDFLLQAKDRQEEDRYRKLDHLIRQQQTLRREAAKPVPVRYIRRLFGEV